MRLIKFFASLACFCLVLGLLITVIDTCSFDHSFYVKEFQDNDTSAATGMSSEDNLAASDALLDYLRGNRDDIVYEAEVDGTVREVFDERETIHMQDVRTLYQRAVGLRNGLVIAGAGILALVYFLNRRRMSVLGLVRSGFQNGAVFVLMLVGAIGLYGAADFTSFWTSFHEFFFDNDYWLLDPNVSIMINLYPENFFSDLVFRIIFWFILILGVSWVLIYRVRRRSTYEKCSAV
ncbi:MAG: TIGR01906 family membrane protein [Bulleidia sp.]